MAKKCSTMVCAIWFTVAIAMVLLKTQSVDGAKTSTISNKNQLKCNKEGDNQIAKNLAQFLIYSKKYGRNWPTNRKEMKLFCKESSELVYKIDLYRNKCFHGQLKQFTSLFVYGCRNFLKRFCGKGAKTQRFNELYDLTKCVNKNKDKHDACMESLIESLVGIKYAEDNKKIPHACCAIGEISQCFGEHMEKDGCGNRRELMEEVFGTFFSSMGPMCNDYNNEESDMCERLGKRPSKKPEDKVPYSLLFPFFDIVDSLPQ